MQLRVSMRKSVLILLFGLVFTLACGADPYLREAQAAEENAGIPLEARPNRLGIPTTGLSEDERALKTAKEEGEQDETDEEKDYWKSIPFDRTNLDEVRKFVQQRYIDATVDSARALSEAASFALSSDEDAAHLILPASFYELRKDHPDEKGQLKGKVVRLNPADKFLLLKGVKAEEEERKKLSDDEIRELRQKIKDRAALLDRHWKDAGFDSQDFDRVMAFISTHFGQGKKSKWTLKKAWVAAAQGYLFALDPHSSLIPKAAWEHSTKEVTDSSFEGIGAILTRRPDSDYTIVETPIAGQPAVKAGLRAGDQIIEVDGKTIKGELLSKVVSRIRGEKGTKVVLTVVREGEPDPLKIGIVRSSIEIKNVTTKMIQHHNDIGYVKVTGFVPSTSDELYRKVMALRREAKKGDLRGLVLDLRDNSGGLLKQGILVADRFVDRGVLVAVKNRHQADEVERAHADGTWDLPVVVLVNDGSASAAEIVASAIQENRRGLVLGDRTFGKASVQTLFTPLLRDEYYIKLTVARYFSPLGRTLQLVGVRPDIMCPEEVGAKMPLGFREENLSRHLSSLSHDYESPNKAWTDKVLACEKVEGKARALHAKDPNPAVKFDYQMMRAADVLECMIKSPRP